LGDPRRKDEPITQRHKDIAASLQKQTEIVVLKLLNEFDVETKNFCFAGGVALNCKLNHEIIKSKKFEGFFVQPAAGDAGVSLGAALLSCVKAGIESFDNSSIVYLGIEYSNKEIKDYLDLCKLKFEYVANPELKAAELIAKNKIVGWFQGRSEWGPRALGNRSILANPMNKYMKDLVNNNIKFREEFRPFAPAVLKESQDKYFKICFDDPYMLTLADVTDYAKKSIPAVIHSDNTARIQTVIRDKNPLFWKLIKNFGEITGEDVVLNTSLNLNGQPLCARLSEAVKAFFSSGMDYIIMGNYMLSKEGK
jgi:carbamoyltransferase